MRSCPILRQLPRGCSVWGHIRQRDVLHLHAALLQYDARPSEGMPPDGVFEGWSRRLDACDAGIDDRPRAIDARGRRWSRAARRPWHGLAAPREDAWRSACSIQTKRPSPSCRSGRSRTPAGKVLQAVMTVPSESRRQAPTCRTLLGLWRATSRASSMSVIKVPRHRESIVAPAWDSPAAEFIVLVRFLRRQRGFRQRTMPSWSRSMGSSSLPAEGDQRDRPASLTDAG